MRIFRVQYAYAKEVGCPAVHSEEEAAKGEVAYLLSNWLTKNLAFAVRRASKEGDHPDFIADGSALIPHIKALVTSGDVWGGYNAWHEFYDRYENEFGYPLYIKIGTVLVETRFKEGPSILQKEMMPHGGPPPMLTEEAGEGGMVAGYREAFENIDLMDEIVDLLRKKAQAKGRPMITPKEFEKQREAVEAGLARQIEASGRQVSMEDFNLNLHYALKKHFGISGRSFRTWP